MLPRIEAEETLNLVSALVAAGGRMLEDNDRARYINQLERRTVGQRRPKRATAHEMTQMGIQVVEEG